MIKSSLQCHGPPLIFVCGTKRVVWMYEDAGSGAKA